MKIYGFGISVDQHLQAENNRKGIDNIVYFT